ncbi:Sortilin, partial [Oryzias melastigma]
MLVQVRYNQQQKYVKVDDVDGQLDSLNSTKKKCPIFSSHREVLPSTRSKVVYKDATGTEVDEDIFNDLVSQGNVVLTVFPSDGEKCKRLIEAVLGTSSGGEEVLEEYHTSQTLKDSTRRKLVNIVVAHMIDKHGHLPTKAVREEYALGIVTLFPSLKDPYSKKGYVNQDFTLLLFDDEAEHVVLDLNTHETGFNGDDGSYVILTWVGDDTGVILVLSTISSPLESFQEGGSSRLYRSIDYGKSFHDISQSINHTFIKEEFGVSVGPGISVILTADTPVLNNPGGIIFTSRDAGASFKLIQLPFHLAQPITYHFSNPDYLAALSIDGGRRQFVLRLQSRRCRGPRVSCTFHPTKDKPSAKRYCHQPPLSSFMADTYFGTMYTSDDRGILFSKSLERHLFDGHRRSDFTNITSLRGAYLTNKLDVDGRIRSVISFNRGGAWRQLDKPENVDCEAHVKKVGRHHRYMRSLRYNIPTSLCFLFLSQCNLHIHGEHSRKNGIVPMLALSEPTAVGLVIAHGTVGDSLSSSQYPDVFVSSDGGYSWKGTLKGPHLYSILDSGGLIVAVEAQHKGQVKTIKFSTDEGQCWKLYNFTEQPFFFAGLASEPGTNAMLVSVWGFRPEDDNQPMWVAVTIDFQSLITRECTTDDYEEWLAHSTEEKDSETNGCVLGVKETYRRLKKESVCRNGRNFVVKKKQSSCLCTREDYICDYGFYRHVNTSECVKQPDATNKTLEMCLNGQEDELLTTG